MQPSDPDEYLTVREVADLLKINQQTIRNWIDRNEFPAVRVGSRRVRIRRTDLDAFLAAGPGKSRNDQPESDLESHVAKQGLAQALDHARGTINSNDDADLAGAARALAKAANRLASPAE